MDMIKEGVVMEQGRCCNGNKEGVVMVTRKVLLP